MKFFAPKHSRYIEVSAPTIIFLISSDTFSQTASQKVEINTIKEFEISQTLKKEKTPANGYYTKKIYR